MTLRDYVLIVARGWIVVVATVAIGLVTAAAVALTTPRSYTASAEVLFTGHASTSGQDLAFVGTYLQARMQTYKNLGTSTNLMEAVAAEIGSDETPPELASRVDIRVSQVNTVATISASDSTAEGAARTANALADGLLGAVQDLEANAGGGEGGDAPPSTTIKGVVTGTAEVPAAPSDPSIPFYLLVGGLTGLVVGLGVISTREVLRGDVSTASASAGTEP